MREPVTLTRAFFQSIPQTKGSGMLAHIDKITIFRQHFYSFLGKRKDAIMNLLDSLSSFGHKARSVVQLSESSRFERGYSSVTDAIADGLPTADWPSIEKLTFATTFDAAAGRPPCFLTDCTSNPRPFANKLSDRTMNHAPNPAPGNRPVCVGHQYSCVALLPSDPVARERKWVTPISMRRVNSEQKGNEVGMQTIVDHIAQFGLKYQLVLSVGDSLYGTQACRALAATQDNLVHIFRVNGKRNVFRQPVIEGANAMKRGRKKEYGEKMRLSDAATHPQPSQQSETAWKSRSGKIYQVKLEAWHDLLMRGSKKHRASKHPMTLVRIRLLDKDGHLLFKKPLWIALFGQRRNDISLISAFQYYKSRYDIEHLFRFSKNKLLLSAHQTTETEHEARWWKLCLVAYNQLYLARSIAPQLPTAWEKYLPEYREGVAHPDCVASPAQTQRGFESVLNKIGTPAAACIQRGKAPGRKKGETVSQRVDQPIIFKRKKSAKDEQKDINSGCGVSVGNSDPQTMADLIQFVCSTLRTLSVPADQFTKMLLNTS